MDKNEWRQIESPNTPPPRCSHQAAFFRDHLYVLGGEFATTEQFYHYKDLWRLDVKVTRTRSSLSDPWRFPRRVHPRVSPEPQACAGDCNRCTNDVQRAQVQKSGVPHISHTLILMGVCLM